jgi:predicted ATPase with chaperone activity
MVGSPGSGKTLLPCAMPGILPEMSIEESLEVTRIYSVADQLPGQRLVRAAMTQLNLSARAYYRILKLARTIADLAGSDEIQSVHLAPGKAQIKRGVSKRAARSASLNYCLDSEGWG